MLLEDVKFCPRRRFATPQDSMNQNPPFPTPEELQAKLSEFMKSNFGDKVSFATFDPAGARGGWRRGETGQTRATTSLFSIFSHATSRRTSTVSSSNRTKRRRSSRSRSAITTTTSITSASLQTKMRSRAEQTEYAKQNVILVGPTGVGKTYLIKHIAELIKVPVRQSGRDQVQRNRLRRW